MLTFLGYNLRQWNAIAEHYLTTGAKPATFTGNDAVRELLYMKFVWDKDGGKRQPDEISFFNGSAKNPVAMELATVLLISALESTIGLTK